MRPIPFSASSPNRANDWCDDRHMPADLPEFGKRERNVSLMRNWSWHGKTWTVRGGDAATANVVDNGSGNAVIDANDVVNDATTVNSFGAFLKFCKIRNVQWKRNFSRLRTEFDSNRTVSRSPRYWTLCCDVTIRHRDTFFELIFRSVSTDCFAVGWFQSKQVLVSAEILKINYEFYFLRSLRPQFLFTVNCVSNRYRHNCLNRRGPPHAIQDETSRRDTNSEKGESIQWNAFEMPTESPKSRWNAVFSHHRQLQLFINRLIVVMATRAHLLNYIHSLSIHYDFIFSPYGYQSRQFCRFNDIREKRTKQRNNTLHYRIHGKQTINIQFIAERIELFFYELILCHAANELFGLWRIESIDAHLKIGLISIHFRLHIDHTNYAYGDWLCGESAILIFV